MISGYVDHQYGILHPVIWLRIQLKTKLDQVAEKSHAIVLTIVNSKVAFVSVANPCKQADLRQPLWAVQVQILTLFWPAPSSWVSLIDDAFINVDDPFLPNKKLDVVLSS